MRMYYLQTKYKTGFTLIEILVVISIAGILATTSFLALSAPTKEAAVNGSYATVITALEATRNRAMQGVGDSSTDHSVIISSDGKSITSNGNTVPFPPSITIEPHNEIVSFERISGRSAAHTLTIKDGATDVETITISAEGYVQ